MSVSWFNAGNNATNITVYNSAILITCTRLILRLDLLISIINRRLNVFVLPYSTELKLNKIPYVTYMVIILCIIVFKFQYDNNKHIENAAKGYCSSITIKSGKLSNEYTCQRILTNIHIYHRDNQPLEEFIAEHYLYSSSIKNEAELIENQYLSFSSNIEQSLDKYLMHYPDEWNPWKMFTSTISHADIWHIGFNLLFFFAFTPALEVLINNKKKFVAVLLAISFVSGVSYSLVSLGSTPIPTLGLSGVVMGMIGLSAYLMPQAKIRVLVWFILFLKTFFIPAWLLAIWYIGWDSWELFNSGNGGGVNLVAHVSGGLTGYLLGMLWFKDRRTEYQEELDDEIDYQCYSRKNSRFQAVSKRDSNELANKMLLKAHSRAYEENFSKIYTYVNTDQDSEALMLLLNDCDIIKTGVDVYEESFDRLSQWKPSKALLCIGRLIIHLYIKKHQFEKAIEYALICQGISKEFVLSSGEEMLLLVQNAINTGYHELAYHLIRNAENRYTGDFDRVHCKLIEIRILWLYLDEPEKSRQLIKKLLERAPTTHREELMNLAIEMK